MAVAIVATDTWVQHLPFVGGPRPTSFGDVDGVFYGVLSGIGAVGGGNFTLSGSLSFDRKEDWVYVIQHVSASRNSEVSGETGFIQVNTGPLIPTSSAVSNPTFAIAALGDVVTNNAVTILGGEKQINTNFKDQLLFGDKRIAGPTLMFATGWETNVDGETYTSSIWGWIIRYNSFFRDVDPRRG